MSDSADANRAAAAATGATEQTFAEGEAVPSQALPRPSHASVSLYVGDLHPDCNENLLVQFFNSVGQAAVASVKVCRDRNTSQSLRYGYVNFFRPEDAERALDSLNFQPVLGKPVRLMWNFRDPSLRRSGNGNIFIKNLHPDIDNKSLYDTFSQFGNILSCKVAADGQGKSLGYGYVHYEGQNSADEAIAKVNNMLIMDKQVSVTRFVRSADRAKNAQSQQWTNVYVKHLDPEFSEDKLRELFTLFGEITSCRLMTDANGASRCFGFVAFSSHEAAAQAVELMHGVHYGTQHLYVGRAMTKAEREREMSRRREDFQRQFANRVQDNNLYIRNLAESINDQELRELFEKFGTIDSAKVMTDSDGSSRGFGFVSFTSSDDAQKAMLKMNTIMIHGKPLYIAIAQRKDVRREQLRMRFASDPQMMQSFMMQNQQGIAPGSGPAVPPGMNPMQPGLYPNAPAPFMYPNVGPAGQRPPFMFPVLRAPMRPWQGMPQPGYGKGAHTSYSVPMPHRRNRRVNPQAAGGVPAMPPMANGQANGRFVGNGPHSPSSRGRGGFQRFGSPRRDMPMMQNGQMEGVPMNMPPGMMLPGQAFPGQVVYPMQPQMNGMQQDSLLPPNLSQFPVEQQKEIIGNKLYFKVHTIEPNLAPKITGMLLDGLDVSELISLLESPEELNLRVGEAAQTINEGSLQGEVAQGAPAADEHAQLNA